MQCKTINMNLSEVTATTNEQIVNDVCVFQYECESYANCVMMT